MPLSSIARATIMHLLPIFLLLSTTYLPLATSRAFVPSGSVSAIHRPFPADQASWNPTSLGTTAAHSSLQAALDSPDPLSSLRNATSKPLGTQVYGCDGNLYGRSLNFGSCVGALMMIPDLMHKFSFGPKTQGNWNFETPSRLLSGDGRCAVDFERNSNALSDYARGSDLLRAAQYLLTECFSDHQQGGIVRNLGDKGRINLIIRTYEPNVQCSSSPASSPTYGTCLSIVGKQMPTDKEVKVFGRREFVTVKEVLPRMIVDSCTHSYSTHFWQESQLMEAADTRKCQLIVNTRGPVDNAAWYDIWGAAVAIDAMCENKNLFAILKKYDAPVEGEIVTDE
ncbi:MAG: hypothetical protein Q9210_005665 [Variospora velana]